MSEEQQVIEDVRKIIVEVQKPVANIVEVQVQGIQGAGAPPIEGKEGQWLTNDGENMFWSELPYATQDENGVVQFATDEEVIEEQDRTVAVTPYDLRHKAELADISIKEDSTDYLTYDSDTGEIGAKVDIATTNQSTNLITSGAVYQTKVELSNNLTQTASEIRNELDQTAEELRDEMTGSVEILSNEISTLSGELSTTKQELQSDINSRVKQTDYDSKMSQLDEINQGLRNDVDNKVEKSTSTVGEFAYSRTNGVDGTITIDSSSASANTIVKRGALGVIFTGTPTNNSHATTKLYVDTADKLLQDAIDENESDISVLQSNVSTINGKIPTQASSSNQLADKAFVSDAINSVSAYYITKNADGDAFSTYAELSSATTFYSGGTLRTPTRNDYCIVISDENHKSEAGIGQTTRYIYNTQWEFQYTISGLSLNQSQLDSINSGITSDLVEQITVNENAIDAETTARQQADITLQNNIDTKVSQEDFDEQIDISEQRHTEIVNEVNTKVTKSTSNTGSFVYARENGVEGVVSVVSDASTANSIVRRDASGRIVVETPVSDSNATTKGYVDSALSSKQVDIGLSVVNGLISVTYEE